MKKSSKRELDLSKSRDSLIHSLNRNKTYVFKSHASMTVSELETRLSLIESVFSQLCAIQTSIEQGSEAEDEFDKRQRFEDIYCEVKSKIMSMLQQKQVRSCTNESTVMSQTLNSTGLINRPSSNLPKLKLPTFSGKYTEWTNWYNTFNSIVDSDSELDDLSKFVHLRSCLGPVPLGTIEFLELTGANYFKAMQLLKRRFENKSIIFQSHVKELFDLERVSHPSSDTLRHLIDVINSHLHSLESLGSVEDLKNVLIFYLARLKLDEETLAKWHEQAKVEELPSWASLETFLAGRCLALESCEVNSEHINDNGNRHIQNKKSVRKHKAKVLSVSAQPNETICPCCGNPHKITQCFNFLNLSPTQRYFEAKKYSMCILCLGKGHSVRDCKAGKCERCSKSHHSMLHRDNASSSNSSDQANIKNRAGNNNKENVALYSSLISVPTMNFLATALVLVKDVSGRFQEIRCILDSGSQLNFITSRLVERLGLPVKRTLMQIMGIGNANAEINGKVSTLLRSRVTDFGCNLELHILTEITNYTANDSVNVDRWNLPKNIKLADPYFNQRGKIDMLVGVGLFFKLLSVGQIKLADNQPILQKSLLGWIVVGECSDMPMNSLIVSEDSNCSEAEDLRNLVEKFWKCESITLDNVPALPPEDQRCENLFLSSVQRSDSGRFVVRLPFREEKCSLGRSYNIALKRFLNLERRLDANPALKTEYVKFIKEYEELGHLEVLSEGFDLGLIKYFIPHHPVIRLESTTTKLRVVFDASSKTDNGISLNDQLLIGTRLQPDLFDILVRFRSYKYALTADISKMFRQVRLHEDDCLYQCILWRSQKTEAVRVLKLKTVTYGTSSAPFLSVRCLKYLADMYKDTKPLGCSAILENFYMDDMLAGANSKDDLFLLKSEVLDVLGSGQFELHKWRSNLNDLNSTQEKLAIQTEDCAKTLGVMWDSKKDVFLFSYIEPQETKYTKRVVLSEIAKLYDPLGLINPVIVLGKIFLQHLWLLKLDWDESLPQTLVSQWQRFRHELRLLNEFEFSRSVCSIDNLGTIELHGFSDASIRAYGAVVYVRIIDSKGNISMHLMTAKSRVAPLKSVSLPRLELEAALLLAKLMERVKSSISFKCSSVLYWTDSTLVLQWLASHPSRWSTFIANRVSKIHSLTFVKDWHKVNGKVNPADIVSRGMYPSELKGSELWFKGPSFLLSSKDNWPKVDDKVNITAEETEERRAEFCLSATCTYEVIDLVSSCKFCKNFLKMQRVFGFIYRWRMRIRRKAGCHSYLTVPELNGGLNYILFNIQNVNFFHEKQNLTLNKNAKSLNIQKLNPFLDDSDICLLRVGGRLTKSDLPYEVKHPILLPSDHEAVTSLIDSIHILNSHAGAVALSAFVRQRFWVINMRKMVRKVVRKCIRCFKHKPKPLVQLMGDLPSYRVKGHNRPFENSGVDFAGPISVHYKIRGKRPYKVYLAIFVCCLTKACHIEIVSDLSTDSFIASLKRFFARRGFCCNLYCDNATNFVGAARKLNCDINSVLTEPGKCAIFNECARRGVEFHFIPPRSPHFGGLWESAVKIAKQLLVRHSNSASLSFEELNTAVTQVEAVMNSRPLCPLSSDANDLEALTPGHFLIGRPLNSFPEPIDEGELNISHSNRWKRIQALQTMFWRRWSREYLTLMQERMKWRTPVKNLDIGTLVLISEDNMPPSKWLLGRVVETHIGEDGLIRVVTLKTKSGILKRSIHRLCPLPIS